MKRIMIIVMMAASVLFLSSCFVHHRGHTAGRSGKVPPGQAKKITGSKSARPHAPGQRKKHGRKGRKHHKVQYHDMQRYDVPYFNEFKE